MDARKVWLGEVYAVDCVRVWWRFYCLMGV